MYYAFRFFFVVFCCFIGYFVFFFFKQKTAYEMATWLEFRRVLFRSVFAVDRDFDPALVQRDPMQMVEDQIAIAQLRVRRGCRPHRPDHERLDLRCWNAGYRSWLRLPLQDGLGDVVTVAA